MYYYEPEEAIKFPWFILTFCFWLVIFSTIMLFVCQLVEDLVFGFTYMYTNFNRKTVIVDLKNFTKEFIEFYKWFFNANHIRQFTGNTELGWIELIKKKKIVVIFWKIVYVIIRIISNKIFFFKVGIKKNAYFNIFLEKKKKFTDWYWDIRN